MKKFKLLSIVSLMLLVSGCGDIEKQKVKIIAPDGTPALGLANFYNDNTDLYSVLDIKSGSDPLKAAFINGSYDIIVAPTNLGAKFYNETNGEKYVLYQTIVWGNLYLVANEEITEFKELANKEITMFGMNSTPDIVMKSLASHYNITLSNVSYENDVSTATSKYIAIEDKTNKCVVSAQPVLSNVSANLSGSYIIDLQSEWAKMTGNSSYPQASIFVKESMKGKLDDTLIALTNSINKAKSNPSTTAENAMKMYTSFEKMGKEALEQAIPNCHYEIEENQKVAIEYYFNKMKDLGLSKQYGEKLPDENFYYSI